MRVSTIVSVGSGRATPFVSLRRRRGARVAAWRRASSRRASWRRAGRGGRSSRRGRGVGGRGAVGARVGRRAGGRRGAVGRGLRGGVGDDRLLGGERGGLARVLGLVGLRFGLRRGLPLAVLLGLRHLGPPRRTGTRVYAAGNHPCEVGRGAGRLRRRTDRAARAPPRRRRPPVPPCGDCRDRDAPRDVPVRSERARGACDRSPGGPKRAACSGGPRDAVPRAVPGRPCGAADGAAQLEAISPWIACRWGVATRVRRRRSNR